MLEENLDRLLNVRDSMDRMTQHVEATQRKLGATRGQDDAGLVTARLDEDGRFVDIAILEAWSEEYEPEELGAAIVSAFTAAATARMEQWATGIEEQSSEPESQTRPMPPRHEDLAVRLHEMVGDQDVDGATASQGLLDQLQQLESALSAAVGSLESRTQSRAPGFNGTRQVQATVDGHGTLTEVVVDTDFAESSHAFNISRAVTEAITRAMTTVSTQAAQDLAPANDLQAIVARLQDPQALTSILKTGTFEH